MMGVVVKEGDCSVDGGCGERGGLALLPFIPVDGFFIYFSTYWYYIVFSHLIIFLE